MLLGGFVSAQKRQAFVYTELDGLPSSWSTSVVQGLDGEIWVATREGVASFDGQRWQRRIPPGVLGRVRRLVRDGERLVAVGQPDHGVALFEGSGWTLLPPPPIRGDAVAVVAAAGTIWIATEQDLARWRGGAWRVVGLPDELGRMHGAAPGHGASGLWLATDSGLWHHANEQSTRWTRDPCFAVASVPATSPAGQAACRIVSHFVFSFG